MEEEEEYRVVFWSPPTIDEVTGAVTSIQEYDLRAHLVKAYLIFRTLLDWI
jgi:hypothetical protein